MNNIFKQIAFGTMLAGTLVSAAPAFAAAGLDGLRSTSPSGVSGWISSWFDIAPVAQENAAHQRLHFVDSPNFNGTVQERDLAILSWLKVHKPTTSGPYSWKYQALPRRGTGLNQFYKPKGMHPSMIWRRQGLFRSDAYGSNGYNSGDIVNDTSSTNDDNSQGAGPGRNGPQ